MVATANSALLFVAAAYGEVGSLVEVGVQVEQLETPGCSADPRWPDRLPLLAIHLVLRNQRSKRWRRSRISDCLSAWLSQSPFYSASMQRAHHGQARDGTTLEWVGLYFVAGQPQRKGRRLQP